MPRLIATQSFPYGVPQRALKAGQEFEASLEDARILKAVGKAKNAPQAPAPELGASEGLLDRKDETGAVQRGGRNKYRRTDMKAEG